MRERAGVPSPKARPVPFSKHLVLNSLAIPCSRERAETTGQSCRPRGTLRRSAGAGSVCRRSLAQSATRCLEARE